MAKPKPAPLASIIAMARYGGRPADLPHVTLLPFADLMEEPPSFLANVIEAMHGFRADAFHVAFDRIVERRCVMLRASWVQEKAREFQRQLISSLRMRGFTAFGTAPIPHLTINYKSDGCGNETIERIGWQVEEVLLIESLHGLSRHEVRGRWSLDRLLM